MSRVSEPVTGRKFGSSVGSKAGYSGPASEKLRDVYLYPIPYQVVSAPPVILHNPVSVFWYLYVCFRSVIYPSLSPQIVHKAELSICDGFPTIKVWDAQSMTAFWRMGFFGKGTLSRSEPSWFGRTARRLGLEGGELSLEEITEQRRNKRRQMKKERSIADKKALALKRQQEGLPLDSNEALVVPEIQDSPEAAAQNIPIRKEDKDLIVGDSIQRLECLQLSSVEAIFLSLGLGVLDIEEKGAKLDVQQLIVKLLFDERKVMEYVVYHYFRSMGWCVRSGIKFGTDYLLYRRGPPFQHAEIVVLVMGKHEQRSWHWHQGVMRVVGGVRKTLMVVHVDVPPYQEWESIASANDLRTMLGRCQVEPIVYSRWAPNRTRD